MFLQERTTGAKDNAQATEGQLAVLIGSGNWITNNNVTLGLEPDHFCEVFDSGVHRISENVGTVSGKWSSAPSANSSLRYMASK